MGSTQAQLFRTWVHSATKWPTNGDLIADVWKLRSIPDDAAVVDLTYGRGSFWTVCRPDNLTAHDLSLDGVDFRDTPHEPDSFDVVVLDPPYIAQGGIKDESPEIMDFRDRYGLQPISEAELHDMILAGLSESARICRPGGLVLVKSMPYVSGSGLTHRPAMLAFAEPRLRLVDELIHLRTRVGPVSVDRQVTSRRNYSVLQLFVKRHRAVTA